MNFLTVVQPVIMTRKQEIVMNTTQESVANLNMTRKTWMAKIVLRICGFYISEWMRPFKSHLSSAKWARPLVHWGVEIVSSSIIQINIHIRLLSLLQNIFSVLIYYYSIQQHLFGIERFDCFEMDIFLNLICLPELLKLL